MSEIKSPNRQVLRSQQMLRDALFDLLQSKPYQKIGISDITDHAGLARSTFYSHFETKDDLLVCCIDEIFEDFFAELDSRPIDLSGRALDIQAFAKIFHEWRKQKDLIKLADSVDIFGIVLNRLRTRHLNTYKKVIAPIYPELNPSLAAYYVDFLASSTVSLLKHWTQEKMIRTPEVMGELLYELTGPPTLRRIADKFEKRFS